MRRSVALPLAIGILLMLTACATAAAARRTTHATVYRAFRANGTSVIAHPRVRTGYCWSGSESTPRRDAWRCMTGNRIEDPCFSVRPSASSVICPDAPWKRTGVKMLLTKPLPHRYGGHAAPSRRLHPWALVLYNGHRCLLAGGASSVLEGKRLNYFCTGERHGGLWGFPQRRSQPWKILTAPFTAKHLRRHVAIRRAWM